MEQPVEDEACELIAPDAVSFDCATDDNDASIPSFVYPKRKNQECCCCCDCTPPRWWYTRAIGNFWVLRETPGEAGHQPQFKWILGPCWPMAIVTTLMIVGLGGLLMTLALKGLGVMWQMSGVVAVCSVVYCFLSTSCSDPGIVPYWEEPQGADWRRLTKCDSWVPKSIGSVGYCEEGQVIVKEYDHFCIWTGTAIGAGNMFCFMCMLKGIVCLLMYVVFLANLHSLGIA